MAVILERKVSLFASPTTASDYSNKTCIYRYMCLYLTKYASLVGVVTCVGEERYFLSIIFDPTIRKYTDVYECAVTVQWLRHDCDHVCKHPVYHHGGEEGECTIARFVISVVFSCSLFCSFLQEFDTDMIVLYEDQQRINTIACKNVLRSDLKQEISDREVKNVHQHG